MKMRNICIAALMLSAGSAMADTQTLTADVWVDNWFVIYANGELVKEDSVPITTERSFNAETFTFTADAPTTIAFELKDYTQNATGLEYIGTNRQQMGDGGAIAQFKDAKTGKTVAVTDEAVHCLVVNRAPIDPSCAKEANPVAGVGACGFVNTEIPANWKDASFDDSSWPAATHYSEREISPKDDYYKITWDSKARLIWSGSLLQDNTLLCRMKIGG